MMSGDVPPVFQRIVETELVPGERVVWTARPSIWKSWRIYFIGFVLCLAAVVEWKIWSLMIPLFRAFPSPEVPLIASMLAFQAILLMFIPLLFWWSSRRTLFLITDRRAIYVLKFISWRIQSFTGDQLIRIGRTENFLGNGSVQFGTWSFSKTNWTFWGITDTRGVAQLLRKTYENTLPNRN